MKAKNGLASFLKTVLCLVYIGFFAMCCFSWISAGSSDGSRVDSSGGGISFPAFHIGTPNVSFANGSFPADAEEVTVALQAGETALLDQFTGLRVADLRGSSCYDEIYAWGQQHPEVTLHYSVPFPNGVEAEETAENLDLSGLVGQQFSESFRRLSYLPKLKVIDLGLCEVSSLPGKEDLDLLHSTYPDVHLTGQVSIGGQSVRLEADTVDLSSLRHADTAVTAQILSCMDRLTYVDLGSQSSGSDLQWEDIGLIQAACPQADVAYGFSLYGKELSTLDETLDFNHISMSDEGAAVRKILPYMQNCTFLDMDFCNVSNKSMAAIRDDFPNIKVVWRIWFGTNYSVRTDVEKILASKPSVGGVLGDSDLQVLRYCTDVKYLDLGHNEAITDISFVYNMPNLEVLVIAMNPLVDITPLASCTHLEYLELNTTEVRDLSPLAELDELRHLNVANCNNLYDITPIYGLTKLERLWIGCITPVPKDQVNEFQELAPDCYINTEVGDPTGGSWRVLRIRDDGWVNFYKYGYYLYEYHPRYELLQEQFGYKEEAYSFSWLDPLYDPHD